MSIKLVEWNEGFGDGFVILNMARSVLNVYVWDGGTKEWNYKIFKWVRLSARILFNVKIKYFY